MPRPRKHGRLYWRERGGVRRAYGDFRDFADAGGKREPLIPRGQRVATSDPVLAEKLVGDRLQELQERRRNKVLLGIERQTTLAEFASHHLVEKAKTGKVTRGWLEEVEKRLETAVVFFGAGRDLASITVRDVQRFAASIGARAGRRDAELSGGTVRHYLNALSNLYRRASSEGYVPSGFNPVGDMIERPSARREEARWLEVHQAALLLEAARVYEPVRGDLAIPCLYPLLATFLLTGGRESEVLGLEVDDISFDRKTITFRPNRWRRLKTRTSRRVIPLHPQLEEILRAYVFGGSRPLGSLLFPSRRVAEERMIWDLRKALDAIAELAGWKAGEIRTKMFRHTYCAARLQTLDRGHPISPWTVAKEMGHGGTALVDRVYGHLGQVRHRSEAVEYRIAQHSEQLGDALRALREQVAIREQETRSREERRRAKEDRIRNRRPRRSAPAEPAD